MNEIDNKELDRLIEDAVFENGARKQLQALENTIRRDERKSRMRRRIIWSASSAISVAAAVVLAVVLWPEDAPSSHIDSNVIAQAPSDPTTPDVSTTTAPPQPDVVPDQTPALSIEEKAKILCGNYLACIDAHRGASEIDEIIRNSVQSLKNGNATQAIVGLENAKKNINQEKTKLDEEDDNDFAELLELNILENDINWYLSLAYLSLGDLNNAEPILRKLATSDNCYGEQAQKILNELYS